MPSRLDRPYGFSALSTCPKSPRDQSPAWPARGLRPSAAVPLSATPVPRDPATTISAGRLTLTATQRASWAGATVSGFSSSATARSAAMPASFHWPAGVGSCQPHVRPDGDADRPGVELAWRFVQHGSPRRDHRRRAAASSGHPDAARDGASPPVCGRDGLRPRSRRLPDRESEPQPADGFGLQTDGFVIRDEIHRPAAPHDDVGAAQPTDRMERPPQRQQRAEVTVT